MTLVVLHPISLYVSLSAVDAYSSNWLRCLPYHIEELIRSWVIYIRVLVLFYRPGHGVSQCRNCSDLQMTYII